MKHGRGCEPRAEEPARLRAVEAGIMRSLILLPLAVILGGAPAHAQQAQPVPIPSQPPEERSGPVAVRTEEVPVAVPEAERPEWSRTLEKISSGVVSIRVDGTRAFDTEWNQSSQATGFIVDAERGLILTNRHVVMPGPVVAQAIFLNREEAELKPVYRDPVHDFGIFRYDPSALRFIKPHELKLRPDRAQVGREIRVVGNDAGEQISILAGTIARLDREAPDYGKNKYNDFNTFYIQAASSTSGGSSGSPVIDVDGNVVALNAGASSGSATSFFLPLDRVERVLHLIQAGEPVTRGTLETVFLQRPYDELRRLGLREQTEERMRAEFPKQTGLLVVSEVVPGGPAEWRLHPGDIVVGANGTPLAEFAPLEEMLDGHVGEDIVVSIERGGEPLDLTMTIGDLNQVTPADYIEFGSSVVHRLSFQQARHYNTPIEGVYVANPGYTLATAGIPRGAVIKELNGTAMHDLDDFERALTHLGDGDRMALRFYTPDDPQRTALQVARMDRRWFPAMRCKRDDTLGYWPCHALADVEPPATPEAGTAHFITSSDPRAAKLAPSLVMVNFDMPYAVSGVTDFHFYGTGVVVDPQRGLVVVDRNTVPVAIGDVRITFAGSLEVPGKVEYIHPLHNLAVISYDPSLLRDTQVRAAEFSDVKPAPGMPIWVVGLKPDHRLVSQPTEIASIDAALFGLTRSFRFRDTNLDTISVVSAPADTDGVLADANGRIVALWSSFAYQSGRDLEQTNKGVPADLVQELVTIVREGRSLRSLEAELFPLPLSQARKLGLPEEVVQRLETHEPERRQVLQVVRVVAGSPAEKLLNVGDLILGIEGNTVTSFREVERAVQKESVQLELWRDGAAHSLPVPTVALEGHDLDRVLVWGGALLQAPHRELAAQRGIERTGVYVAYFAYGSPATSYGLWAGSRIVEVDGHPVPDLDTFIEAVADKTDRDSVRLTSVEWNGAVDVTTLKLDNKYWAAYELRLTPDNGWQRFDLTGATSSLAGMPQVPESETVLPASQSRQ
jgi:S1-C subfamily serine protease